MGLHKESTISFAYIARHNIAQAYGDWSGRLNKLIEISCALLLGIMVLVIWLGIFDRYFIGLNITWTEELARYLMIWSALLAIPCCARRREHIGFDLILGKLSLQQATILRSLTDLIAIAFFIYLTIYGWKITVDGAYQYATIFNMSMMLPFAAVPISSLLTVVQLINSSSLIQGPLTTKEECSI